MQICSQFSSSSSWKKQVGYFPPLSVAIHCRENVSVPNHAPNVNNVNHLLYHVAISFNESRRKTKKSSYPPLFSFASYRPSVTGILSWARMAGSSGSILVSKKVLESPSLHLTVRIRKKCCNKRGPLNIVLNLFR